MKVLWHVARALESTSTMPARIISLLRPSLVRLPMGRIAIEQDSPLEVQKRGELECELRGGKTR